VIGVVWLCAVVGQEGLQDGPCGDRQYAAGSEAGTEDGRVVETSEA